MKLDRITDRILMAAFNEAKHRKHEYFTPEHVLYSALFFDEGKEIIESCGGDVEALKKDLSGYFEEYVPVVESGDPEGTQGVEALLNHSALHVASSGRNTIEVGDVFAAIYEQKDSFAAYYLLEQGITRLSILRYISHGASVLSKASGDEDAPQEEADAETVDGTVEKKPEGKEQGGFLSKFSVDLTEKAARGEIDPLIGREEILERTIQVLSRRLKNNPVHVGDPGVGKTAITEGLASMIVAGHVPRALQGSRVYYLDMGSMLAGTKYRGDFEERMKKVLDVIEKQGSSIVYLDEIHTIVGAGAVSGGSMDASNILKPYLVSGKLRFIGSTTYEEYKKYFEKDRALSRRFQKIEITEPTVEEAYKILEGLKERYEKYHGVAYSEAALKAAVELSAKYLNDRHLPDKAIDLMDEAGAYARMHAGDEVEILPISEKDMERIIASIAKIPEQSVTKDETGKLKDLEKDLKKQLYGQDKAVDTVAKAIKRSRAGFNEGEKPVASLLFVGPTGVGKTELSRQLAKTLGIPLIRFDMSEYQEKHTVARLIGAPPGYVGYEEGGLLTDSIRKTPYCVLLLDEIEKAHSDIFNVLLQVMDYATLTDNTGKKADFRNVILIMTSNAGARDIGRTMIGFENRSMGRGAITKEVERLFSPEFRNRLDEIVVFNPIDREMARQVARKAVNLFEEKLAAKHICLEVTERCYEWLAEKGLSSTYGAREILRIVQDRIKSYFVDEVLFGKLSAGGRAKIDVLEDEVCFEVLSSNGAGER